MEGTENEKVNETKIDNGIEEQVNNQFEQMNNIVENTLVAETNTEEPVSTEINTDDQSNVGQSEQPIVEDLGVLETTEPISETENQEEIPPVITEPIVEVVETPAIVETVAENVVEPIIEENVTDKIEQPSDTNIEPAKTGNETENEDDKGDGETGTDGSSTEPTITTEKPTAGEDKIDEDAIPPTETPNETSPTDTSDVESEAYEEVVALIRAEHLFSYDVIGKHLKNGLDAESLKKFHVDFVKAGICSKPEHYKILELLTKLFGAV